MTAWALVQRVIDMGEDMKFYSMAEPLDTDEIPVYPSRKLARKNKQGDEVVKKVDIQITGRG